MQYTGKTYRALLTLLQAGLWERRPQDISMFPLSEAEWQSVFILAQQQAVLGITYRGLDYLPEHLFPSGDLIFRWVAEIGLIEERNLESNRSLIELLELFGQVGLRPILQKGQGVATMYDRPLLRSCGDIDLWFPSHKEAEKALERGGTVYSLGDIVHNRMEVQRLEELGLRTITHADKAPDGSFHYHWRGIEVEHHPDLIDLQAIGVKRWARKQVKALQPATVTLPEHPERAIQTPSATINLLLINAHICKHAIGLGVGLRQMCDMARAYHALHREVDGEQIRSLYRRAGLERWSNLLHRFLVDYIGLEEHLLPYRSKLEESARPLLKVVLRGGNFGRYAADREVVMGNLWQRKWHTALSFVRNCRFSFRYAPAEAIWTVWQLAKGQ